MTGAVPLIIRVEHRSGSWDDDPGVLVRTDVIHDANISLEAVGVYVFLCAGAVPRPVSHPAFRELVAAGYVLADGTVLP